MLIIPELRVVDDQRHILQRVVSQAREATHPEIRIEHFPEGAKDMSSVETLLDAQVERVHALQSSALVRLGRCRVHGTTQRIVPYKGMIMPCEIHV